MSQKLIDYTDLCAKGVNSSLITLWRWERAGKFPKRVRVSHSKVAWVESEIDEFLAKRIASRAA